MCSDAGDARALQRLRLRELLADRHQAGHLGLGDADFLAAPGGEGEVGDDVRGGGFRLQDGVHVKGSNSNEEPAERTSEGRQNSPTRTIVRVSAVAMWNCAKPGTRTRGSCLATLLGQRCDSSAARMTAASRPLIIPRVIPPSVAPWSRCEPRRLAGVRGVLTDIDDTLTTEGAIPMGVVAALAALREAGLPVIAVTGRPMGWSRAVAAQTPLAAVVAENGSVALVRDGDEVRVELRRSRAGAQRQRRAPARRRRAHRRRDPGRDAGARTAPAGSPTSPSTTPSSRTSIRRGSPRWSR